MPDLSSIITAFFGSQAFGIMIGGLITYWVTTTSENQRAKSTELQRRQQTFSQLQGQRNLVTQYYVSDNMAFIQANYCIMLRKVADKFGRVQKESYDRMQEEGLRSEIGAEELAIELGKAQKDLWEIIGKIQVLFNDTNKLKDFIQKIEDSEKKFEDFENKLKGEFEKGLQDINIEILSSTHGSATSDWPKSKEIELKVIVGEFRRHIDDLLGYLKEKIDYERGQRLKPEGVFYIDPLA